MFNGNKISQKFFDKKLIISKLKSFNNFRKVWFARYSSSVNCLKLNFRVNEALNCNLLQNPAFYSSSDKKDPHLGLVTSFNNISFYTFNRFFNVQPAITSSLNPSIFNKSHTNFSKFNIHPLLLKYDINLLFLDKGYFKLATFYVFFIKSIFIFFIFFLLFFFILIFPFMVFILKYIYALLFNFEFDIVRGFLLNQDPLPYLPFLGKFSDSIMVIFKLYFYYDNAANPSLNSIEFMLFNFFASYWPAFDQIVGSEEYTDLIWYVLSLLLQGDSKLDLFSLYIFYNSSFIYESLKMVLDYFLLKTIILQPDLFSFNPHLFPLFSDLTHRRWLNWYRDPYNTIVVVPEVFIYYEIPINIPIILDIRGFIVARINDISHLWFTRLPTFITTPMAIFSSFLVQSIPVPAPIVKFSFYLWNKIPDPVTLYTIDLLSYYYTYFAEPPLPYYAFKLKELEFWVYAYLVDRVDENGLLYDKYDKSLMGILKSFLISSFGYDWIFLPIDLMWWGTSVYMHSWVVQFFNSFYKTNFLFSNLLLLLLLVCLTYFCFFFLYFFFLKIFEKSDPWLYISNWLYTVNSDNRFNSINNLYHYLRPTHLSNSTKVLNLIKDVSSYNNTNSTYYNTYQLYSAVLAEETFAGYVGFNNVFPSEQSVLDKRGWFSNKLYSFKLKFKLRKIRSLFFKTKKVRYKKTFIETFTSKYSSPSGLSFFNYNSAKLSRFYVFSKNSKILPIINFFARLITMPDNVTARARESIHEYGRIKYEHEEAYSLIDITNEQPDNDLTLGLGSRNLPLKSLIEKNKLESALSEENRNKFVVKNYMNLIFNNEYLSYLSDWDQKIISRSMNSNTLSSVLLKKQLRLFKFSRYGSFLNSYTFTENNLNYDDHLEYNFEQRGKGSVLFDQESNFLIDVEDDEYDDLYFDYGDEDFFEDGFLYKTEDFYDDEVEEDMSFDGLKSEEPDPLNFENFFEGDDKGDLNEDDLEELVGLDILEKGWGQEFDNRERYFKSKRPKVDGDLPQYISRSMFEDNQFSNIYNDLSDNYVLNNFFHNYSNFFFFPQNRFIYFPRKSWEFNSGSWLYRNKFTIIKLFFFKQIFDFFSIKNNLLVFFFFFYFITWFTIFYSFYYFLYIMFSVVSYHSISFIFLNITLPTMLLVFLLTIIYFFISTCFELVFASIFSTSRYFSFFVSILLFFFFFFSKFNNSKLNKLDYRSVFERNYDFNNLPKTINKLWFSNLGTNFGREKNLILLNFIQNFDNQLSRFNKNIKTLHNYQPTHLDPFYNLFKRYIVFVGSDNLNFFTRKTNRLTTIHQYSVNSLVSWWSPHKLDLTLPPAINKNYRSSLFYSVKEFYFNRNYFLYNVSSDSYCSYITFSSQYDFYVNYDINFYDYCLPRNINTTQLYKNFLNLKLTLTCDSNFTNFILNKNNWNTYSNNFNNNYNGYCSYSNSQISFSKDGSNLRSLFLKENLSLGEDTMLNLFYTTTELPNFTNKNSFFSFSESSNLNLDVNSNKKYPDYIRCRKTKFSNRFDLNTGKRFSKLVYDNKNYLKSRLSYDFATPYNLIDRYYTRNTAFNDNLVDLTDFENYNFFMSNYLNKNISYKTLANRQKILNYEFKPKFFFTRDLFYLHFFK